MLRWFIPVALAWVVLPLYARGAADKMAPSIAVQTLDGKTVRLFETSGRVALVDFWASWCEPCKASFPALDALSSSLRERGVDVLAVNVDEKRKNADAFLARQPHTIRVLLDPRMSAAEAFKVNAIPTAFIIDQRGRIRFTHPAYGVEAIDIFRREIAGLLEETQH